MNTRAILASRLSGALLFLLLVFTACRTLGQGYSDTIAGCGTDADYLLKCGTSPSHAPVVSVSSFPDSAIFTCGKIDVYYEDVHRHFGLGFDDTTTLGGTTLGEQRRATFCAALTYIQSVYDFSLIPDSAHIRLYVDTSLMPGIRPSPSDYAVFAASAPYYDTTHRGITAGYLNGYILTGTDPCPGQFHANMAFNFDQIYSALYGNIPVPWHNDVYQPFTNITACQEADLRSCITHEFTHCMGWVSLLKFPQTGLTGTEAAGLGLAPSPVIVSTNLFSKLDWSFTVGGNTYPLSLFKVLSGTVDSPYIDPGMDTTVLLSNNNYWLNDSAAPMNHPVYSGSYPYAPGSTGPTIHSFLSHVDDQALCYNMRERVSPGDQIEYLMGPFLPLGVLRRSYTKGEVQAMTRVLGYRLNDSFAAANPDILPNHVPFSTRMAGYGITWDNYAYFTESVPADDTLVNDSGASITVDIRSLTASGAIVDADPGDTARVYFDSASLFNIRGCGSGGNNHALLRVSSDGKRITYTPRHNFYGKAQIGVNLNDTHEEGGFVVLTVEVLKGTNVSCPVAANMVCNPGFEEGTEVMVDTTAETVRNAVITEVGLHEGRWQGVCFSDSHPYCFHSDFNGFYHGVVSGAIAENTYYHCGTLDSSTTWVGTIWMSCPNGLGLGWGGDLPYPPDSGGYRYQTFSAPGGSYYYLADSTRQCHRYILEFDLFRTAMATFYNLPLQIGFADHTVDPETTSPSVSFNFQYNDTLPTDTTRSWRHFSIPFTYCGSLPSNILYLSYGGISASSQFNVDNLSLREDTSAPPPLTGYIVDTGLGSCFTQLTAWANDPLCSISCVWNATAKTSLTGISDTVKSDSAATYTVVMSDGCRSIELSTSIRDTLPDHIHGPGNVCPGLTISLSDSVAGGAWSSGDTALATVDVGSGGVTGIATGVVIISYTTFCTHVTTFPVTVNPAPHIMGAAWVCPGLPVAFSDSVTGGTWRSSDSAVAVVGTSSGEVTGVANGSALISYTTPAGCVITAALIVNPLPSPVTGPPAICIGATASFTDTATGGTWLSSNTSVAAIGLHSGVATGVSAGMATILYITPCHDTAAAVLAVMAHPSVITGSTQFCYTGHFPEAVLHDSVSGGIWTSSDSAIVLPDYSGLIVGLSAGSAIITYAMCGAYATVPVFMYPEPGPIRGNAVFCAGTSSTLTDSVSGGAWTSGNTAAASVGSHSGVVTGIAAGTAVITYTIGICSSTDTVTVEAAPGSLSGLTNLCDGSAATWTDTTAGGTWSSSNSSVATVSGGVVTGVAAGTALISYRIGDGCLTYLAVTINPVPDPIMGGFEVCAGSAISDYDAVGGGSWSSSDTSVATVSGGTITGVMAGYVVISYTLPGGCYADEVAVVNPLPARFTVTGGGAYCTGGSGSDISLTGSASGVTYKLYDGLTLVSSLSGTGSALDFGPDTSSGTYFVVAVNAATGCRDTMSGTATVTIDPVPGPITGLTSLCAGNTTSLSDATTGGTWSSGNTSVAIVSGGTVTGVAAGTAIISYTLDGLCAATDMVIVYPGSGSGACTPCSYFTASFATIGTSGSITSSVGPGSYYVPNSVTVYGTDTFRDAVIVMASGALMTIDTGAVLTIDSSHILSCAMWDGMTLRSGFGSSARLSVIGGSLIEDATTAVYIANPVNSLHGLVLDCDNAVFNRNMTAIDVNYYNSLNAAYPFLVRNTVISGRDYSSYAGYPYAWPPTLGTGGLKTPYSSGNIFDPPFNIQNYTGTNCKNGQPPYAGLVLDSVGADTPNTQIYPGVSLPTYYAGFTLGDTTEAPGNLYQNLLDNVEFGVYATNSNVDVVNSAFINIDSREPLYTGVAGATTVSGDAIYAIATPDLYNHDRLRVWTPGSNPYHNLFYGFLNAVACYNYFHVIGQYNYIINKNTGATFIARPGGPGPTGNCGFWLQSAKYDTIDISYDTITNVSYGVTFWAMSDPVPVGVCCVTPPWQYTGQINVNGNLIQVNPGGVTAISGTQRVQVGISLQNALNQVAAVPNPSIYGGSVMVADNQINDAYDGIYINNFWRQPATAYNNTIYVRSYNANALQYGVNNTHCSNSTISYNSIQGADVSDMQRDSMRAVYASSNNKLNVGCNTESNTGRGFEFFIQNPITKWYQNNMSANGKGFVLNGGVIGPQGDSLGLTPQNVWTGGLWSASSPETFVINAIATSSPMYVTGTLGGLEYPNFNAVGTRGESPYEPSHGLNWERSTSTYFCYPVTPGTEYSLYEYMAQQEVPYGYSLIPANWMAQFRLWESMLIDSSMADSSRVLAVFDSMAQNSRYAYLTALEIQIAAGNFDSAWTMLGYNIDSMANTSVDSATQVKMADGTSSDYIVQNYQRFYALYMTYVADTLSGSDSLAILALAQLCPEENGTVVYQARALYSLIYNDLSMFNEDSCMNIDSTYIGERHSNPNGGVAQANAGQVYKIYPNPNNGNFTIAQLVPDMQPVSTEIFDVVGQCIFRNDLQFAGGTYDVQLNGYAAGVYIVRLKDARGREFNLKFVKE